MKSISFEFDLTDFKDQESINELLRITKDSYPLSYQQLILSDNIPFDRLDTLRKEKVFQKMCMIVNDLFWRDQVEWEQTIREKIRDAQSSSELRELQFELKQFFRYSDSSSFSEWKLKKTLVSIVVDPDDQWYHIDDKRVIRENDMINKLIEEKIEFLDSVGKIQRSESEKEHLSNLVWKGKKNELEELVYVLFLSKKVFSKQTGTTATQRELIDAFNNFIQPDNAKRLNADNLSGNILRYYRKNKRALNNRFHIDDLESIFLKELRTLLQEDKDKKQDRT